LSKHNFDGMNKKIWTGALVVIVIAIGIFVLKYSTKKSPLVSEGLVPFAFTSKYITKTLWPPKVYEIIDDYSCAVGGTEISSVGVTIEKMLDGISYCIKTQSEGVAGSTYTTYTYKTATVSGGMLMTTFTLRFVQCDNYDDPERSECKDERVNFSADTLAQEIFQKTKSVNITLGSDDSCYLYQHTATLEKPYTVSEYLTLREKDGEIVGKKDGTQSGPDMTNGYTGTLVGTQSEDMITLVYSYTIEGSDGKEEELYQIVSDGIVKHRYPLIEKDGVLVPNETESPTDLLYSTVSCK